MAISPSERQAILADLSTLAIRDLVSTWRRVSLVDTEFAAFMIDVFPEIATTWASAAADNAAQWYDESAPALPFKATPASPPPVEALVRSAEWALGAEGVKALDRMAGTLQRAVFDGARETIYTNTEAEAGSRWARHASANACAFCRMAATRGAVYASESSAAGVVGRRAEISLGDRRRIAAGLTTREQAYANRSTYRSKRAADKVGRRVGDEKLRRTRGSRGVGEKYHDHCRCVAIEVRPGRSYEPAPYVEDWQAQYTEARALAEKGEFGAVSTKDLLAAWRQLDK